MMKKGFWAVVEEGEESVCVCGWWSSVFLEQNKVLGHQVMAVEEGGGGLFSIF